MGGLKFLRIFWEQKAEIVSKSKNIFFILTSKKQTWVPHMTPDIHIKHFLPYFPTPLSFFCLVSRQQQAYLQTVSLSFDLWTRNLWSHRRREWQFFDSFRSRWGEHFTSCFGWNSLAHLQFDDVCTLWISSPSTKWLAFLGSWLRACFYFLHHHLSFKYL